MTGINVKVVAFQEGLPALLPRGCQLDIADAHLRTCGYVLHGAEADLATFEALHGVRLAGVVDQCTRRVDANSYTCKVHSACHTGSSALNVAQGQHALSGGTNTVQAIGFQPARTHHTSSMLYG